MKRFSRLIAFVLVVAMTVSLFADGQMPVFATEDEVSEDITLDTTQFDATSSGYFDDGTTAVINGTSVVLYTSRYPGSSGIRLDVEENTEVTLIDYYVYEEDNITLYGIKYTGTSNEELAEAAGEYGSYTLLKSDSVTIGSAPEASASPAPTPTATPSAEPTTSPEADETTAPTETPEEIIKNFVTDEGEILSKDYYEVSDEPLATINADTVIVYDGIEDNAKGLELANVKDTEIYLSQEIIYQNGMVLYRYYAAENEGTVYEAQLDGYFFIPATDVAIAEDVSDTYVDSVSGVSVSGDIPEGATLSVTSKTLVETGIDTTIYPVGENSLFYDVTLVDESNNETQPGEGGITVTFPKDKILAAGFVTGDSYHVYHIHDGVIDMTAAAAYGGGDISIHFDNLSEIGIVEAEESIDMSSNPVVAQEDLRDDEGYGVSAILTNEVVLYDGLENASVHTATVTGYEGTEIELIYKITLQDGSVYYQYAYYGDDTDFNTIAKTYTLISSEDVTIGTSETLIDATTGIIVTGNIPDNVTLVVTPQYFTEIPDYVDTSFFDWHDYIFLGYDISLIDSEGNKWQPADGETVTVTIPKAWNPEWGIYTRADVYHLNDDDATVKEMFSTQNDNVTLLEDGGIAFEVGSFSTFVVGSGTTTTVSITTTDGDNHTQEQKGHIVYLEKGGNALVSISGLRGNITAPERIADTSNGTILHNIEGTSCRITAPNASVGDSCIFKWTWTSDSKEYTAEVLVIVVDPDDTTDYTNYHSNVIHHIQLNVEQVAVLVNGEVVDTLDDVALGFTDSTVGTLTRVLDADSAVGYYYTYTYTVPASGTEGEDDYVPPYDATITLKIDETQTYYDANGNVVDPSTLDFIISDVLLVEGSTDGEQDQVTFVGTFPKGIETDTGEVRYLLSIETSYYGENEDFYGDRLSFSTSIGYWDDGNVCPGASMGNNPNDPNGDGGSGGIDVAEFSMGYTIDDITYYVVYSDLTKIIKGDVLEDTDLQNATKQFTFTVYRRLLNPAEGAENPWEEFDTFTITGDFIDDGNGRSVSTMTIATVAEKYDPANLGQYQFMLVETGNNVDGYSCDVAYNKTNGIFLFDRISGAVNAVKYSYGTAGTNSTQFYVLKDGNGAITGYKVVTTIVSTSTGWKDNVTTKTTYETVLDKDGTYDSTNPTTVTKVTSGGMNSGTTTSKSNWETHKSIMTGVSSTVKGLDFSDETGTEVTVGTIVYSATISCTNTYEEVETGLTVNKVVNGSGAPAGEMFTVTITPTGSTTWDKTTYNYYINGSEIAKPVTVANGVLTVTITAGQSLYFDIPEGTYRIQETEGNTIGFTYDITPYTRTLTSTAGAAVTITNIFSADATLGSLKISKDVVTENENYSKPTGDSRAEFTFNVTIGSADASYSYAVYESTGTLLTSGTLVLYGGVGAITLRDGQYAIIDGIKHGTAYSVEEVVTSGYTLEKSTGTEGYIVAASTVEAEFVNTYTQPEVTIYYKVVGPDGNIDTSSTYGTVTQSQETLYVATGSATGSTASSKNELYKFIGWYSDEACTNKVGDNATYVPTKTDGTLWIDGTTYYAKFEYNLTSLTINKQGWDSNDADQTFLFKLMDASGKELTMVAVHENGSITIEGLTVGETYKIVELTNWSWRYSYDGIDNDKTTVSVTDTVIENGAEFTLNPTGNVITFNNTRPKEQWLDGNSYEVNIFDGKAN